jgi:hypothetical protein
MNELSDFIEFLVVPSQIGNLAEGQLSRQGKIRVHRVHVFSVGGHYSSVQYPISNIQYPVSSIHNGAPAVVECCSDSRARDFFRFEGTQHALEGGLSTYLRYE